MVEAQKVVAAANDPHPEYKDLGQPLGAPPIERHFTPLVRRNAFDTGTVAVLPNPPVPDVPKFDSPFKEPAVAKGNEPVNTPAVANVVSPTEQKREADAVKARSGEAPAREDLPPSRPQSIAPSVTQEAPPTFERSTTSIVPQVQPAQMTVAKNLLPKGFKHAGSLNVRERTTAEERQLAAKPQQRSLSDVQAYIDKHRNVGVMPGKAGQHY